MQLDNLGSAESFTITATRLRGQVFSPIRHFADRYGILADQVLELRVRGQLIHALKKRKATDAYSRL